MDDEIRSFLLRHLKAIEKNDNATYHETTAPELSLYEWWVTPHRIEGLPFHEFMMDVNSQHGAVFGSDVRGKAVTRYDVANLSIQRYGDAAITCYTLLVSTASPDGVRVASHNETRVIVRQNGKWKVVHVHKSPAWPAPHTQPS